MAGPQDFQVVSLCVQHPECGKSGKLVCWNNLSKLTRFEVKVCPKCGSKILFVSRTELIRKLTEALNGVSTEQMLSRALRDCISVTATNGIRIEMAGIQHLLDMQFAEKQKAAMREFIDGVRGVLSGTDF